MTFDDILIVEILTSGKSEGTAEQDEKAATSTVQQLEVTKETTGGTALINVTRSVNIALHEPRFNGMYV